MAKASTQKSSLDSSPLAKVSSTKELKQLQKVFSGIIMKPLLDGDAMHFDERSAQMILPNDRLTAHERLELYARQYWWRIRDSIYEDFPGLHAALGNKLFYPLMEAYLNKHPSRSFTLRNLGQFLSKFILENPRLTHPYTKLAYDIVCLEWAKIDAFDSGEHPSLNESSFVGKDPTSIKVMLQPHIQLLELDYPVNRFLISLKQKESEGEASNTIRKKRQRKVKRISRPRAKKTFLAVHRKNFKIFFKELSEPEYKILIEFKNASTIEEGLSRVKRISKIRPEMLQQFFHEWTSLGWFCQKR